MLSEISPPGFRSTLPGVAYQLGNMISSVSAQIETGQYSLDGCSMFPHLLRPSVIGQHARTVIKTTNGAKKRTRLRSDLWHVCSHPSSSSHPSGTEATSRDETAFQADASREDVDSIPGGDDLVHDVEWFSAGSMGAEKKEIVQLIETKGPSRDLFV